MLVHEFLHVGADAQWLKVALEDLANRSDQVVLSYDTPRHLAKADVVGLVRAGYGARGNELNTTTKTRARFINDGIANQICAFYN